MNRRLALGPGAGITYGLFSNPVRGTQFGDDDIDHAHAHASLAEEWLASWNTTSTPRRPLAGSGNSNGEVALAIRRRNKPSNARAESAKCLRLVRPEVGWGCPSPTCTCTSRRPPSALSRQRPAAPSYRPAGPSATTTQYRGGFGVGIGMDPLGMDPIGWQADVWVASSLFAPHRRPPPCSPNAQPVGCGESVVWGIQASNHVPSIFLSTPISPASPQTAVSASHAPNWASLPSSEWLVSPKASVSAEERTDRTRTMAALSAPSVRMAPLPHGDHASIGLWRGRPRGTASGRLHWARTAGLMTVYIYCRRGALWTPWATMCQIEGVPRREIQLSPVAQYVAAQHSQSPRSRLRRHSGMGSACSGLQAHSHRPWRLLLGHLQCGL